MSGPFFSINAAVMDSRPRKIRVNPSFIHSMVITLALSMLMAQNPATTPAVGIRWDMPHAISIPEPVYISIFLIIFFTFDY